MRIKNVLLSLTVIGVFSCTPSAPAGDGSNIYWVSPTGTATWSNCESSSPLSGTSACRLRTANTNAVAGDNINLRAGTYSTNVAPSNSGSSGSIIEYQAYNDESVTISNASLIGILLDGRSYVKVDGIEVTNVLRLASLQNDSHYNEITNCKIHDPGNNADQGIFLRDVKGPDYATNNWIHGNTLYNAGWVSSGRGCNDEGGVMKVGDDSSGDQRSGYNTIEDNVIYNGGHHVLRLSSKYNVIRNNVFYNYGWMTDPGGCTKGPNINGKYGGRILTIPDYYNKSGGLYNLIEGNRFGHAGKPPDDDGGHNLVIFSPRNIVRYNYLFGASYQGIYLRGRASDYNMIYNNTIYKNGYEGYSLIADGSHDGGGIGTLGPYGDSNAIKNNISYANYGKGCDPDLCNLGNNTVTNNWDTDCEVAEYCGDPKFVNTDMSDRASTTLPDLSLQPSSGAIDKGVALTTVISGCGGSTTQISLADATYFQNGSWGSALSNIQADWIAVDSVGNTVQISSISGNAVNLVSSISCINGDDVWLYKNSHGKRVLHGPAPDLGAYEYLGLPAPKNPRGIEIN